MDVEVQDFTKLKIQTYTKRINLKPCPFCGGINLFMVIAEVASIECKNESCGAMIHYGATNYDPARGSRAVVRRWNKRSDAGRLLKTKRP